MTWLLSEFNYTGTLYTFSCFLQAPDTQKPARLVVFTHKVGIFLHKLVLIADDAEETEPQVQTSDTWHNMMSRKGPLGQQSLEFHLGGQQLFGGYLEQQSFGGQANPPASQAAAKS